MNPKLIQALCAAKYEADSQMLACISNCIQKRSQRTARLKLWAFSFLGLMSFIGLFPAVKLLTSDFTQSGSYQYFSLLFSDSTTVLSYWKEFIFSVLESLPFVSMTIALSLFFVLFLSLKYMSKQIIKPKLRLAGSLAAY